METNPTQPILQYTKLNSKVFENKSFQNIIYCRDNFIVTDTNFIGEINA